MRTSEEKTSHLASDLADSTALKLLQPLIMVILVPLVGWGGNKVLDRMDKIELALNASAATAVANEYRLRAIETTHPKFEAQMYSMNDRLNQLTMRIELMSVSKK